MSLHDAVAKYVQSGDTICFGGFTTNRKPYAVMGEILRQGQTDFTVWAGPAGGDWDMMIGEGRVKAYINCYTANSGYTNVSRRFRAAIEGGKLTYEDYSQDVLMLQLHAAALGLPYLPVKLMSGSGLCKFWGISEEQRKTIDSVDNLKFAYVENPFNPGETVVAVPVPKLDTAVIHVQKASPDGTCIIEGDEFHDVDIAVASQCYNYYDCDDAAMKEYDKASKYQDKEDAEKQIAKEKAKAEKKGLPYNAPVDPETFKDYLDKWVYSVKDNDELLDKIGGARLAKLKVIPGLGYAKR